MGIKREETRNFLLLTGDIGPVGSQSRGISKEENERNNSHRNDGSKDWGCKLCFINAACLTTNHNTNKPDPREERKNRRLLASILSVSRRNMN
jgi:hypothetical protein